MAYSNRRISRRVLVLFAVIVGMAVVYATIGDPYDTYSDDTLVTKVIDGDTVMIQGGQSVRLIGIDTRERGQNCYQEAKDYMIELVLMKNVTLEKDAEDKDQYGRLLRYIFIDGKSVNEMMITSGLAVAYSIEPNTKYSKELALDEKDAMNQGGCVWTTMP